MSIEQRSCSSSAPHVTKRLFTIVLLLTGLLCMFGGYLLGRISHTESKRGSVLLTHNLTVITNLLYKKARRVTPKVILHNNSARIQTTLASIFNCSQICGSVNKYNLSDFVRNAINYQVAKLIRSINNATMYLDSLS